MHDRQGAVGFGQLFQHLKRGITAARAVQSLGPAQFCGVKGRVVAGHTAIGAGGQIQLVQFLKQLCRQQDRIGMFGAQIFGHAGIDKGVIGGRLATQGGGHGIENLGHAIGGASDMGKGQAVAVFQLLAHLIQSGVQVAAKQFVQQFNRLVIAVKLA